MSTESNHDRFIKEIKEMAGDDVMVLDMSNLADYMASFGPLNRSVRRYRANEMSPFLPQDHLVPTMGRLLSGEIFDFRSDQAPRKTREQLEQAGGRSSKAHSERNNQFSRVITTILSLPTKEGEEALNLMTDELRRQRTQEVPDFPSLREWWCKFSLGAAMATSLEFNQNSFGDGSGAARLGDAAQIFRVEMQEQSSAFVRVLESIGTQDLLTILEFADLYNFTWRGLLRVSNKDLAQAEGDEEKAKYKESLLLRHRVTTAGIEAWARVVDRADWGLPEIAVVLNALPNFQSPTTTINTIVALENTLQNKINISPGQAVTLSPAGIAELVKFKWTDEASERSLSDNSDLKEYLEETVQIGEASIPRKYLPSTAINLLQNLAENISSEDLLKLLTDVYQQGIKKSNLTLPWLVTLIALGDKDPVIREAVRDQVRTWDGISSSLREVILDRQPGVVWLTQNGRVRVEKPNTTLFSAYPIFSATGAQAQAKSNSRQTQGSKEAAAVKVLEVPVEKFAEAPLLEEVGVAPASHTRLLIDKLFATPYSFLNDEEKLWEDFQKLAAVLAQGHTSPRSILYLPGLNTADLILQNAARLGVAAVLTKGTGVQFILDLQLSQAKRGKEVLPVAIEGQLNKEGILQIEGMDELFTLEPGRVFLNNLGLHLATRRRYRLGTDPTHDQQIRPSLNDLLTEWNREKRFRAKKELPRLSLDSALAAVALSISSEEAVIL